MAASSITRLLSQRVNNDPPLYTLYSQAMWLKDRITHRLQGPTS
jgi:hypothetical protein